MRRALSAVVAIAMFTTACQSIPTRDLAVGETAPAPIAISRVPLHVPDKVLADEIDASVTLRYLIDGNGSVAEVEILESYPPGLLDESASDAFRKWKFEPLVIEGVPVRRWSDPLTILIFVNHCPDVDSEGREIMKMCAQAM